jgi:CRISPR/Cas system CSM-associated protein Csm3 (group 7 of RAMP superfamily)
MSQTLPLDRWIISGTLTNLSAMAIRSGETQTERRQDDPDETVENTLLALDHQGRPYLPATAIKGLLRAIATIRLEEGWYCDAIQRLFGDLPRDDRKADKQDESTQQAQGGSAEFRDGFTQAKKESAILTRGQTRIDRKYGTAEDKLLRQGQFASEGLTFRIEIVVDRADENDVRLLCSLLAALDGTSPQSRMGGAGGAPVRFDQGKVEHLSRDEIAKWLVAAVDNKNANARWQDFGSAIADRSEWFVPPPDRGDLVTIPLALPIAGHFLVSRTNPDKKGKDDQPALIPAAPRAGKADRAWLPKSALKGALRSQAERICRTLGVQGKDPDWHDTPVETLFGSTDRAGLLLCSDLSGPQGQKPVILDMVAIDRLSGSAADGAKFAVQAWEAPCLVGQLQLVRSRVLSHQLSGKPGQDQPAPVDDAAIGLLALLLRDLGEGDIALGYGARKGFGHVKPDSWDLRAAIGTLGGPDEVRTCVNAFRTWAKPAKVTEGGAA